MAKQATELGPWEIVDNGEWDRDRRTFSARRGIADRHADSADAQAEADRFNDRERLADAALDLLAELRRVEWNGASPYGLKVCPCCEGMAPDEPNSAGYVRQHAGHREGCELAAALAKAEGHTA